MQSKHYENYHHYRMSTLRKDKFSIFRWENSIIVVIFAKQCYCLKWISQVWLKKPYQTKFEGNE